MATTEQLAEAALQRDGLRLRSLAQDLIRETARFSAIARPNSEDPRTLAVAAALIELLAARHSQAPPAWTKEVGPMPAPFFLLESAERMKRLRALCETESPEPLRNRRLFAPPNFLQFA
jgi:hypothetical protein